MLIEVKRDVCKEKFTLGKMYINGEFFGYTLEDPVRPAGVKVYGDTAIPALTYAVVVNYSEHFKKALPLLLDVPGFSGVRIHGGNRTSDTLGCILVAKNRDTSRGIIWSSLSDDLCRKIREVVFGAPVSLTVSNPS